MERTRIDPFLWAHELRGGHVYDIATGLKPSSVRDQVTRARLIIRRALEFGIIRSDGPPVVISGAGIAGVVAALEAVQNSVPVILVEKEKVPFRLQRRCITRKIDPNLYNWPSHRWDAATYPSHPDDRVPLWFTAQERPHDVALRWTRVLHDVADTWPRYLQVHYKTSVDDVSPDLDPATKTHTVTFSNRKADEKASMVVFAQGPGVERDTLDPDHDTFRGFRFWDTDPLGKENFNAKDLLIAGSGDGALQDLLRLVVRPRSDLRRLVRDLRLPEPVCAEIQALRDHNTATFLWCADFHHEHESETFVHERHLALIDDLFKGAYRRTILNAIKPFVQPALTQRRIVMAHACGHFTHGYPLNRFLVLLIERALRELDIRTVQLRPHTFVTGITCDHAFGRSPHRRRYCFGQRHRVTFAQGECFDAPPKAGPKDKVQYFDGILLRLGIMGAPPIEWIRQPEKPLRQFLPDHLAHAR